MKLLVFPNDPLDVTLAKGEVKERYFNPGDFFDEVHLVSLSSTEVDPEQVQRLVGTARVAVHALGRPGLVGLLSLRKRALDLAREVKPDLIRAYSNLFGGWLGASCGRRLCIPTVVSLHANQDKDHKDLVRRGVKRRSLQNLRYWLWLSLTEDFVLSNADKVICKYEFAAQYARSHRARQIEVIYNQVDTARFVPVDRFRRTPPFTILSVNRQDEDKDPTPLLCAMQGLHARLVLVGNGVLHQPLRRLAASLSVADRVEFVRAVPHSELQDYYARADVYAVSIAVGGIPTGAMEAMSSGLPVVYGRTPWEERPEIVGEVAVMVPPSAEGFRQGITKLLEDAALRERLGAQGRQRILALGGDQMEQRERDVHASFFSAGQAASAVGISSRGQ